MKWICAWLHFFLNHAHVSFLSSEKICNWITWPVIHWPEDAKLMLSSVSISCIFSEQLEVIADSSLVSLYPSVYFSLWPGQFFTLTVSACAENKCEVHHLSNWIVLELWMATPCLLPKGTCLQCDIVWTNSTTVFYCARLKLSVHRIFPAKTRRPCSNTGRPLHFRWP